MRSISCKNPRFFAYVTLYKLAIENINIGIQYKKIPLVYNGIKKIMNIGYQYLLFFLERNVKKIIGA